MKIKPRSSGVNVCSSSSWLSSTCTWWWWWPDDDDVDESLEWWTNIGFIELDDKFDEDTLIK